MPLLLTVVVVLLAAELGARALAPRLPDPLVWHTEDTQARVEQMDRLGHADIAFVGSSLVAYGIDPGVVADGIGAEVVAYNAGLTAGVPSLVRPWTLHVVVPRLAPDVVVVGVGSFDFTDHPSGRVFRDAFTSSIGGRRATTPDDVLANLSWEVGRHSTLWAYRDRLRQPLLVVDALLGRPPAAHPDVVVLQDDGRTTHLQDQTFQPHLALGPGLPVGDWELGAREPAALRDLLRTLRDAGTQVVLVAMPTTDAYIGRHPRGEVDHAAYLAAARAMAEDLDVAFVAHDEMRDPRLFLDQVHLNRRGATALSQALADDLRGRIAG